jgi:hypothetical protein
MITIILENDKNEVLAKIGEPDNRSILLRHTDDDAYKILSEISECDYEIVLSEDVSQLITELESIKPELTEKQTFHVNEIIKLAKIAQNKNGYALTFTPFE